jgi:hypothetical protein
MNPQSNCIWERFDKRILDEVYSIAFRKKIYLGTEEFRQDLDDRLGRYNTKRTHQGKRGQGRTPMEPS